MGKAWQAFERSAKKDGFFDAGLDHLVRPRTEAHQTVRQPSTEEGADRPHDDGEQRRRNDRPGGGNLGSGSGGHHPLI